MFLEKHILHFSDGREVVAQIESRSPQSKHSVAWSGNTELIPDERRVKACQSPHLNMLMKNLERELGAVLKTESSGQFENWAE